MQALNSPPFFLLRFYPCFRSPEFPSLSSSLFFDLRFPLSLVPVSLFLAATTVFHARIRSLPRILLHPEIIRTVSLCGITGRANCFPLIRFHGTRVIKPSFPRDPVSPARLDVAFIFRGRGGWMENGWTTIRRV